MTGIASMSIYFVYGVRGECITQEKEQEKRNTSFPNICIHIPIVSIFLALSYPAKEGSPYGRSCKPALLSSPLPTTVPP
jgi:hypothetical protein